MVVGRGVPSLVSPLSIQLPLCGWARSSNKSLFQVWVIANKVQGSHGLSRGTVCRRMGVQPREPKGQGWDYGIGVSAVAIWDCSIAPSMRGLVEEPLVEYVSPK